MVNPRSTALPALADWACAVRWPETSPAIKNKILDSVVDTVGVTIAGAAHADFLAISRFVAALGDQNHEASLWHTGAGLSAASAAFANGSAGHLLDFDDVHYLIHGHPTTVILPAVLATAQATGASGERVLTATIAGIGVMAAVARAFGPEHYSRGWHSTSTCGVIGAAAACAIVRGLPADRVANAMAISISLAQGVRANFGTLLKPMHAGFAARGGVEAALLSSAGVDASPTALEGPLGGIALFGDGSWDGDVAGLIDDAENAAFGLGLKPYPCCRGAHYTVDAALDARAKLAHDDEIVGIELTVPLGSKTALIYDDPTTGLEAKFSLPYTTCTALQRGLPLIDHFADDAVFDRDVRRLMAVLTVTQDDSNGDLSSTMDGRYADITVITADGKRVNARVDDARGSATRPLTPEEVDEKFIAATAPVLGDATTTALRDRLRDLAAATTVTDLFS